MELHQTLKFLKSQGRKLLGCFPLYPPAELFHAMDLEPLVMWGLKPYFRDTKKGDEHLQNFVCSVARRLTEFVFSDASPFLDGLFMYNACDTLRNLPEILSCGLEDEGRNLPLLNIHVPMVPLGRTDARNYLKKEIEMLIASLETTFGSCFSPSRFKESIRLYSRARALAKRLEAEVANGRLQLEEFVSLMQGNYLRPVETQTELMESTLVEVGEKDPAECGNQSAGRIILSGILPPPLEICSHIEEAGLKVVGNDIASLARSYSWIPRITASAADYYIDFYSNHCPCPTLLGSADKRIAGLEALIDESQAQGVIFVGEKFCEYEYFEFPFLQRLCRSKGVCATLLEFGIDDQSLGPVKTRIDAFSEMIR